MDARGQVVAYEKGNPLLEQLCNKEGRWRMMTSGPDLMILGRMRGQSGPPVDAGQELPQIALAGEISAAGGLADIIAFIHQNRWTGTLHCVLETSHRRVEFAEGEVTAASSNLPGDRLGELLYDYGRISRADLDAALAETGPEHRIGQVLTQRGLVTPAELFAFIRKQTQEVFCAVLRLRQGSYCFERRPLDHNVTFSSLETLSTTELLLDGIRRIDEMRYFREKIPSSDSILARRVPHPELAGLSEELRRTLIAVDGRSSVLEIARMTQLGEFEATRALYSLLESGFIEVARPKSILDQDPSQDLTLGTPSPESALVAVNELIARLGGMFASPEKAAELRQHAISFLRRDRRDPFGRASGTARHAAPVVAEDIDLMANLVGQDAIWSQREVRELASFLLFVARDMLGRVHHEEISRHFQETLSRP